MNNDYDQDEHNHYVEARYIIEEMMLKFIDKK